MVRKSANLLCLMGGLLEPLGRTPADLLALAGVPKSVINLFFDIYHWPMFVERKVH